MPARKRSGLRRASQQQEGSSTRGPKESLSRRGEDPRSDPAATCADPQGPAGLELDGWPGEAGEPSGEAGGAGAPGPRRRKGRESLQERQEGRPWGAPSPRARAGPRLRDGLESRQHLRARPTPPPDTRATAPWLGSPDAWPCLEPLAAASPAWVIAKPPRPGWLPPQQPAAEQKRGLLAVRVVAWVPVRVRFLPGDWHTRPGPDRPPKSEKRPR